MSDFFVGQIMLAGFGFAPKYFAQCSGQFLPISQNQALFSLLGTQFGGDGVTNFALPDLRGRAPVGYPPSAAGNWQPPQVQMGERAGAEQVALTVGQLPPHVHAVAAATAPGDNRIPAGRAYATSNDRSGTARPLYAAAGGAMVSMGPQTVAETGGSQPHPNLQPYAAINFCIALNGIFPSRN
ncbi:tail fiber protein [Luteimonas sp. RD2P54]|uniref:Tail fiber protein n=1 Tax=Luteimonas endophytica TaxID=3042023 RepID=A0ABT6J920_9GAMM|nr:tail fiber protein [Luteimonas endophytica]MDH5822688.1 tail fiber protein [Luteimonas endophytica]